MPADPRRRSSALVSPSLLALSLACVAGAVACGIGIRRDYGATPVGQVGFDDMCGLQDYFDAIESRMARAPTVVSAVDIEVEANQRVQGGKNRFAFDSEFQLKHLRRVLNENWNRLPEQVARADRLDLEVHWSEKAGVRRVVTETDAELIIGRESFPLPYHVCLSELLFGEPLYHQRRELTGRSLPYKSLLGDGGLPVPAPDAGAAPAVAPPVAIYDGGPPAPLLAPATRAPAAPAPAPGLPAAPAPVAPRVDASAPAPSASPVFKPAPPAH